jgi:FkbM family methyltransferase
MLTPFRHWLVRLLGGQVSAPATAVAHVGVSDAVELSHQPDTMPYDEHLLERARTQWQFGDWLSLAQLNRETLQHHPDRAKLALLAAGGRLQTGQDAEARAYIRLAQDWGVSKKLVSQVLIAGVHNSIGRAAAIGNQQHRALQHFESAIQIGTPGADAKLLTQARTVEQLHQLGLRSTESNQKLEVFEKPNTVIEIKNNSPKSKVTTADEKQKFSSDAEIDDFIRDAAIYFKNRLIVYVDVGAFIGEVFLRLVASKSINIREAHLIEPNPDSYLRLRNAVKGIKNKKINTYNIGISCKQGLAKFKAANSMTKRIHTDLSIEKTTNFFEVECQRLDDISEIFTDKHVHLMKIDVEGEELDVLKSAENLLKEQRVDMIYVEVGFNRAGTQQTYFSYIDEFLQSYDYRVLKIYEQKNEWIDNSPFLRRCNFAYISAKFKSEIQSNR